MFILYLLLNVMNVQLNSLTAKTCCGFQGGWSKEATQQFCKMTDNKKLYMTVVSERNNVLQVDLSKPVLDATKNEVPISIRDALVFLELAQFITPDSGNITGNLMQMMSFFLPECFELC